MDVYSGSVSWDGVTIVKDVSQFPLIRVWLMVKNVPPGGAFVNPAYAVPKAWAIQAQLFEGAVHGSPACKRRTIIA